MRRLTMLIAGGVLAVACAGCGSATDQESAVAADSGPGITAEDQREEGNLQLTLGEDASMVSRVAGCSLTVTAFAVVETKVISGADVPAGSKVWAVKFSLSNTGTATYNTSPVSGALVIDKQGHTYKPLSGHIRLKAGDTFKAPLRLASQGSVTGFIPFVLPAKESVDQIRFGIDSGNGDTALWRAI